MGSTQTKAEHVIEVNPAQIQNSLLKLLENTGTKYEYSDANTLDYIKTETIKGGNINQNPNKALVDIIRNSEFSELDKLKEGMIGGAASTEINSIFNRQMTDTPATIKEDKNVVLQYLEQIGALKGGAKKSKNEKDDDDLEDKEDEDEDLEDEKRVEDKEDDLDEDEDEDEEEEDVEEAGLKKNASNAEANKSESSSLSPDVAHSYTNVSSNKYSPFVSDSVSDYKIGTRNNWFN